MASNSILLLAIFLLVTSKVFSHEEDLEIMANNVNPQVPAPVSAPPVKAPTPTPPVKSPSYPPGPVTTPSPTIPPVKVPPPQSPTVKPPTPTPTPPVVYPPPPLSPVVKSTKDCIPLCNGRCQLHSRKKLCLRACTTCCYRCKCVPPGTYGNREMCGKCYTDMLTHGNKYKCP